MDSRRAKSAIEMNRSCTFVFLVLAALVAGCSQPPPVTVQGKVVGYRGQSVAHCVVSFWPDDGQSSRVPAAKCDDEGSFTLQCAVGSYTATVVPPKPLGQGAIPQPAQPGDAVPDQYRSAVNSPLKVDVPSEGLPDAVFELK